MGSIRPQLNFPEFNKPRTLLLQSFLNGKNNSDPQATKRLRTGNSDNSSLHS